jgi:tRNA-dihydrouridine synthase C
MLGRGMVADPGLACTIRSAATGLPWAHIAPLLAHYWQLVQPRVEARHRAGRIKQWLNFLRRVHPEAQALYEQLKPVNAVPDVDVLMRALARLA